MERRNRIIDRLCTTWEHFAFEDDDIVPENKISTTAPSGNRAVVLAAGKDFNALEPFGCHCLVPCGQHPLLWYPLNILQKHAFKHVDIICARNAEIEVREFVEREFPQMLAKLHSLPGEGLNGSDRGTLDLLREIRYEAHKNSEILVLPCDVVLLNPMVITRAFETHWKRDAALTVVLSEPEVEPIPAPGGSKHDVTLDVAVLEPRSERLLRIQSAKSVTKDIEVEPFVANQFPTVEVRTKLRNSHIMIIRGMVVNHLLNQRKWSNLYDDAITQLVADQAVLKKKTDKATQKKGKKRHGSGVGDEGSGFAEFMAKALKDELWSEMLFEKSDATFCCGFVVPSGELCWRANSGAALQQAVTALLSRQDLLERRHKSAQVTPKCNVGPECVLEPDVQVGERCKVKSSVLGRNAVLKPKVKVTCSVVMENVTLEEGVTLQNCIIGRGATIGKDSDLKDCIVLPLREVCSETSTASEVLR